MNEEHPIVASLFLLFLVALISLIVASGAYEKGKEDALRAVEEKYEIAFKYWPLWNAYPMWENQIFNSEMNVQVEKHGDTFIVDPYQINMIDKDHEEEFRAFVVDLVGREIKARYPNAKVIGPPKG
jgi:hypothetical protein